MSRKKIKQKTNKNNIEMWTEEQYEQYMKELYGMDFIAGYTEGGVPYGIVYNEENLFNEDSEELPFC